MKKLLNVFIALIILVILIAISGVIYVVSETNQVVITQFGKPVGNPITIAGLHFKKPFIQKTHYFEKRLLEWDGNPTQIPTKDKKYIWVDTIARWKIVDALKFLQSVTNETGAQARIDDIINSAARDAVTNHLLVETVRNSNRIVREAREKEKETGENTAIIAEALKPVEVGRQKLERTILNRARELAPQYGIELVDVRIKRVNYVEGVRSEVYRRMISERKAAAEQYRSEGQGRRAEIEGKMGKALKLITSEAYRQAEGIKGKADAEVTGIYAKAYNQDPEFYSFLKTLETYKKTIDETTTIILTTDSDYYKYLKGLNSIK